MSILAFLFAAISGSSLVSFVVWVLVVGLITWLLLWLIGYCGVPEPFNKVLRVVVMIIAVVFLINAILQITGSGGFIKW